MAKKGHSAHDGHRDRMRDRFRETGLESFAPHEVIEMLLYYSYKRGNTNEIAHELIHKFGSFHAVMDANYHDLTKVDGVGDTSATLIRFMSDVIKYYCKDRASMDLKKMETYSQCKEYIKSLFVGKTRECIYLLCLTPQKQVKHTIMIREGSFDTTYIEPWDDIISPLNRVECKDFILAHNHPFGLPVFSSKDVYTTLTLKKACKGLGVDFVDHLLVAEDVCVSMIEEEILEQFEKQMIQEEKDRENGTVKK